MNTVNTDIAPSWFPSETPDERVYWRAGLRPLELRMQLWLQGTDRRIIVYTSERAAWRGRERFILRGDYVADECSPVIVGPRDSVNDHARSYMARMVIVFDEQGNIVEEWTV